MPDPSPFDRLPSSSRRDAPTALISTLKNRSKLVSAVRSFFDSAGFWEVETPALSADIVVDAWLEPFVADGLPSPPNWREQRQPRYLQTSPEFAMKRLLASGADSIYQICKVFRNGEVGRLHNPEFTMVEWYRLGDDLTALMQFTEALVKHVFSSAMPLHNPSDTASSVMAERVLHPDAFQQLTYRDAFQQRAGCDVLTCETAQLHSIARGNELVPPPGLADDDRDGWLNFLLATLVEPTLGQDRPTFLTNYPASQAALAKLSDDGLTAERFELYINGIELCNGYDELTDASVLRSRIQEQTQIRAQHGLRPLPTTNRLLNAMESGLPACAGNALGLDRLIMLALGFHEIADVIPFPFEIA